MKQWNLIIDVALCENCNNCVLATKDEHVDNEFPGYAAPQPRHGSNWIDITRKVRGSGHMTDVAYLPTMCNHCDNAPCVAAGRGAVSKRPDGIVIIDPQAAKGRRDIVGSCPYRAISWNDKLQLPQKWIFDAHLLDQGWDQPRGAQACPTHAMRAVKVDTQEMAALERDLNLQVLRPELGLRPRVYYRNLHRFMKCFVGASVVAMVDGWKECVSGAQATLLDSSGNKLQSCVSDVFGDVKFDGLEPRGGAYSILVSHAKHGTVRREIAVDEDSVCMGELLLS